MSGKSDEMYTIPLSSDSDTGISFFPWFIQLLVVASTRNFWSRALLYPYIALVIDLPMWGKKN